MQLPLFVSDVLQRCSTVEMVLVLVLVWDKKASN
jgi:hypothetical protein